MQDKPLKSHPFGVPVPVIQRTCFFLICLFCTPNLLAAAEISVQDQIRQRIESIRSGNSPIVSEEPIASVQVLPALYEQHDYAPIWTRSDSIDQLDSKSAQL